MLKVCGNQRNVLIFYMPKSDIPENGLHFWTALNIYRLKNWNSICSIHIYILLQFVRFWHLLSLQKTYQLRTPRIFGRLMRSRRGRSLMTSTTQGHHQSKTNCYTSITNRFIGAIDIEYSIPILSLVRKFHLGEGTFLSFFNLSSVPICCMKIAEQTLHSYFGIKTREICMVHFGGIGVIL